MMPVAGKYATSTQVKELESRGRDTARNIERELTHDLALALLEKQQQEMVRTTVWSGIPGLLEHEIEQGEWADHPAREQVE